MYNATVMKKSRILLLPTALLLAAVMTSCHEWRPRRDHQPPAPLNNLPALRHKPAPQGAENRGPQHQQPPGPSRTHRTGPLRVGQGVYYH